MSAFTALLLTAMVFDLFGDAAGVEITYSGQLTPVAVADGKADKKGFTVTWSLRQSDGEPTAAMFLLTEDAAAQPWPARFGFCDAGNMGEEGPRIGYRFDDRDHTVALPGMVFPQIEKLVADREIADGPIRHSIVEEERVQGRDCLIVESTSALGRDSTLAVEKSTGLIVTCERTVFLGRGDRFLLSMELKNASPLSGEQAAVHDRIARQLRSIAEAIGQGERDAAADLPANVLEALSKQIEPLKQACDATSFAPLATAIARNVDEQHKRAAGVDGLAEKILGTNSPALALNDLDGKPLDKTLLSDKIVVLHFWEYDRDALEAPYGQVGYLDFLHRRHNPDGVAVIGVATNPAFGNPEGRRKAARSAKNLVEFMNLDYPLASDDGTLLRQFGDPRPLGAPLPLWVVVDAKGVVRVKSGLYDVQPNEGLKELDAGVTNLIDK